MIAISVYRLIEAYCDRSFDPSREMQSIVVTSFCNVFSVESTGSHKYIPTERLNYDLKLPDGAGVYGYIKFSDGSYLLQTCDGPLAVWDGDAGTAKFLNAAPKIRIRSVEK